jgi:hypothetical protein
MFAGKLVERRTGFGLKAAVIALLLMPLTAMAQLTPMGGHYAARESDTGFAGATNSQGGYDASVPLEFPAARGGMAVPVQVTSSGRRFGAAGLGWDVPITYLYRDVTIARRRPANLPDVSPQAREQFSLMQNGQRIDLIPNAAGTAWFARRNSTQLEVRRLRDSLAMYDGEGHTYIFSAQGPAAGTRLAGGEGLETRSARIERDRYDPSLDDVRSILEDVCEAAGAESRFVVPGFGQDSWPVDVRTDLPDFLEQLPDL